MGLASTLVRGFGRWIHAILQFCIAIAIILIIYYELTGLAAGWSCGLGTPGTGNSLCQYGYVVCGVSIVVTLWLMTTVCLQCACWKLLDVWNDWLLAGFMTIWWCGAALTFLAFYLKNGNSAAQHKWRLAVLILAWGAFFLWACDFIGSQVRCCHHAFGCCGGSEVRERRRIEAERTRQEREAAAANKLHGNNNTTTVITAITDPESPPVQEEQPQAARRNWFGKPQYTDNTTNRYAENVVPSPSYPAVAPAGATHGPSQV